MFNNGLPLLITVAMTLIVVVADYFLKLSSQTPSPLLASSFWVGLLLYSVSAIGWVWVMRHLKLATIGVVFGVVTVLCLTVIGLVGFQERLRWYESCGVALAIVSLILLARFQ